jgi:hypothetical protein
MTFEDLEFEIDEFTGESSHHIFDNHYGVSVIRGPYTYGGKQGLYELAVIYMAPNAEYSDLVYDTPVTNNVEGYLTPEDVTRLMKEVSKLPLRTKIKT